MAGLSLSYCQLIKIVLSQIGGSPLKQVYTQLSQGAKQIVTGSGVIPNPLTEVKAVIDQITNAINTASYAQQVAPESQLQQQARGLAGGLGGYQQYLDQAQQYSGPQAYQQFMSPYQQQVIDTTLTEFDKQRQQAMAGQQAQAVAGGAFGGAREGVQRAEYGAQTLQDRAALQAQLLQQGFGQAQQQAAQAFQQQQGLASLQPQLAGQEAQQLGTLGGQASAYQQSILDAQATAAREAAFEPYTRYGLVGQQLTGLVGGFPTQVQTYQQQHRVCRE
jgi:hypothetical protein